MKIFLATKNPHKKAEMKRILEPEGIEVITEDDLETDLPEVEETGKTFEENALIKARSAANFTGCISVSDDSGLCVDALFGAPGIYSARYSGDDGNSKANNEKLLRELKNVPMEKRTAKFVCTVACVFPNGEYFISKGECSGYIAEKMSADDGFGYDPLFISEKGCFSLLTPEEKDEISHRGKALENFKKDFINFIEKGEKLC